MKYRINDKEIVIEAEGRIDSTNSESTGNEIDGILSENPHDSVVIDAEKLEYISSAGLRVVLRIRKNEPQLRIINASTEVYEIFEMTGFTEMITIEKAFRKLSVDGCKVIGEGAKGTVYRYNEDTIIKVYKNPDSLPDIKNERALARRAFVLGIPTAISYDIVRVGESYGSVFELLDAKQFSQLIAEEPENFEHYVSEYAMLLRKIHSTEVKPDDMPDIKVFVNVWLDQAEPFLSRESAEKLRKLISEVPDTMNMLHCDYHTNNVMLQNGETLLIDMDTLSHGHPIFDLANMYTTYIGFGTGDCKSVVEKFLGLPYETSERIWKTVLADYLGTDDAAVLADVESKARLISSIRLIRHAVKRGDYENGAGKCYFDEGRNYIEKNVGQIDTLDF